MLRLFCEEGRKTRQGRSGNRLPLLNRHVDGDAEAMYAGCAGVDAGRAAATASVGGNARFEALADIQAVCSGHASRVWSGPASRAAFLGECIRRKEQINPTIQQSGAAAQSAYCGGAHLPSPFSCSPCT